MNRRLYRSRTDSVLGGVAGGVAEYLDIDPSIVRVIWAVLAIVTGGLFLLLYIVMWVVVPESPTWAAPVAGSVPPAPVTPTAAGDAATADTADTADGDPSAPPAASTAASPAWGTGWQDPARRRAGSGGAWIFGLILIGLGVWFLIDEYLPAFDRRFVWPVALVVIGAVLLLVSLRRRT